MIKRYDIEADTPYTVIHEYNVEDGPYVKYEDHAAEVARLNEQILSLTRKGDDLLNERLRLIEKVESHALYISSLEVERKAFEGIQDRATENKQLNEQVRALASENAAKQEFIKTCLQGSYLGGSAIHALGERLGLFVRETYQPALHGYICGHEAGEDSVYVMKPSPNTDAILNEVRAQAVQDSDDAKRMNWLVSHYVEVRTPLVYGSHALFVAQCDSDDHEEYHTTLREQIDAARIRKGEQP